MSYLTSFRLEARHVDPAAATDLRQALTDVDAPFTFIDYDPSLQELYAEPKYDWCWYSHEDDICTVSAAVPDALIRLHGEGENRDDVWDKYFTGGKLVETCYAKLIQPAPEKVRWDA